MAGKQRLGLGGTQARRKLRSRARSAGPRFRGQRGESLLCLWEKMGNRKNIGEDKSRYDLTNSVTRANATSLCTSAYYLRRHYQCIILGLRFSEHMILCAYDLRAYDLSGRMIFSKRMICVCMVFLCV